MKYRAKIKVFSDGTRQVILQKSLLGIIWFNMYVKTGNYSGNIKKIVVDYPYEYKPLVVQDYETAANVFEWITTSNNHYVFIDNFDNAIIFGIPRKGFEFGYHASTDLNDIKQIENDIKQIEKELFPKNTSGSKCIETFKFIYNKSDKQLHPTV